VWQWQGEYRDPGVCDGTMWQLSLRDGKRRLMSGAQNAVPPGLSVFLRAVERLTGRRVVAP
jgi:hypothetical protein